MCAGSVLGGNPLFRGPEIPGRGGPADRRGGEDAPRGQLRRLRIRRMPGHGRRAREARRHLGALLPRGRRRLYESRGCIPRKGRCRKAARGGDRPLRRHVREASPHQRVQRGQVVCRGFVALCGRDGLRVRLSGLRRLRRGLRLRRHSHQPGNGTSGGRRRQVHGLRCLREGMSENDHRTAEEMAQEPCGVRVVRVEGQGRRGDEGLQGRMYRLWQVCESMRLRCHHRGEQPRLHRPAEV